MHDDLLAFTPCRQLRSLRAEAQTQEEDSLALWEWRWTPTPVQLESLTATETRLYFGPKHAAKSCSHLKIGNFQIRTEAAERTLRTQDSGVAVLGSDGVSLRYGIVQRILVVDFWQDAIMVLDINFFRRSGSNDSFMEGSTRVKRSSVAGGVFSKELFSPKSIVKQVFYVKDPRDRRYMHVFDLVAPRHEFSRGETDEAGMLRL